MGLCNTEYAAMHKLKRVVQVMINDYLANDKFFARLRGYLQLANDNIARIEEIVKANNSYYEGCTFTRFAFDKECLIVKEKYELTLYYKQHGEDKFAPVGISGFLWLLIECGLLSD